MHQASLLFYGRVLLFPVLVLLAVVVSSFDSTRLFVGIREFSSRYFGNDVFTCWMTLGDCRPAGKGPKGINRGRSCREILDQSMIE